MEIISKISKGSRMDQIYIPKERIPGFEIGESVIIKPILKDEVVSMQNPFYYNIRSVEPIKNSIIKKIFTELNYLDNVIITGSFLEKGFRFEDIDVILISDNYKIDLIKITSKINKLGLNTHIICMTNKELLNGYSTDPLFQLMLSRFISKKRIIFKKISKINFKLLDLYLLKSRSLIDNYELLTGREKYKLTRNLFSILLFLDDKQVSLKSVNLEINKYFGKDTVIKISENMLNKEVFLKKYKLIYNKLFNRIMKGVRNEQK